MRLFRDKISTLDLHLNRILVSLRVSVELKVQTHSNTHTHSYPHWFPIQRLQSYDIPQKEYRPRTPGKIHNNNKIVPAYWVKEEEWMEEWFHRNDRAYCYQATQY